jgi:hypothetical protein
MNSSHEDVSAFDPSVYLDSTTEEALTRRPPLPVGDYVGTVGEPKPRAWTSKKEDAKVKSGVSLDIPVTIDLTAYPDVMDSLGGLTQVTVQASLFLDMKDPKTIDWGVGKNGGLRRWREALEMNVAGQPFSIRQMTGRQIRVRIKHRIYEGEQFDEIDTVAKV